MSIYELMKAQKNSKGAKRATISLLMSEICVDGKPVDDEKAIKILDGMRKSSLKVYHDLIEAGRLRHATEEREYCELIMQFIPPPAKLHEINEVIDELGVERNMKSMGAVMKALKAKYPVVDGKMVKTALIG